MFGENTVWSYWVLNLTNLQLRAADKMVFQLLALGAQKLLWKQHFLPDSREKKAKAEQNKERQIRILETCAADNERTSINSFYFTTVPSPLTHNELFSLEQEVLISMWSILVK